MNTELDKLADAVGLLQPGNECLRLAFGHACVARIEHLLEEPEVVACLHALGAYLEGRLDAQGLARACEDAQQLASRHRGSKSIDGCGHAAVSASYAVANALSGKALQAASYAAYATVYAEGGYGAVGERAAFEPVFDWQVDTLREVARRCEAHAG
jgi:hypothetical protein